LGKGVILMVAGAMVSESLVDAKDEARRAESEASLEKALNRFTWRFIGFVTVVVLGAAGLVITVLGAMSNGS